jgi:hypothetical protein
MNVRDIGWGIMDRIDLAQDRDRWRDLVNTVMNLRVPENVEDQAPRFQLVIETTSLNKTARVVVSSVK